MIQFMNLKITTVKSLKNLDLIFNLKANLIINIISNSLNKFIRNLIISCIINFFIRPIINLITNFVVNTKTNFISNNLMVSTKNCKTLCISTIYLTSKFRRNHSQTTLISPPKHYMDSNLQRN